MNGYTSTSWMQAFQEAATESARVAHNMRERAMSEAKVKTSGSHHTTPRRVVSIEDELWKPFQDLAQYRHMSASALVRQLMVTELEKARISGEMKRVKAKKQAAS